MSNEDGYHVAQQYSLIDKAAKEAGSTLASPFMTLSFMALLVIPHLKLSDLGLFDGDKFEFVNRNNFASVFTDVHFFLLFGQFCHCPILVVILTKKLRIPTSKKSSARPTALAKPAPVLPFQREYFPDKILAQPLNFYTGIDGKS